MCRALTYHIMNRFLPLYLLVALLVAGIVAACNEEISVGGTSVNNNNCEVSSFSLQRNDSVLSRLDSIYFAINLVDAEIYNADSLPVGTKISKLCVKVGTESASACNITYRLLGTDRDTTVNLVDSPNDSINFSNGPVRMEIVSFNGQAKRTYSVRVNVHKSAPDTLVWDSEASRPLPSSLSSITGQKTVMFNGQAHTFTTDGTQYSMAVITDPYTMTHTVSAVSLPEGTQIESITATDSELYCLDADGTLYSSLDGIEWTALDVTMDYIYGGYESMVLGVRNDGTQWTHLTFPATTEVAVPEGCPVSGTSNLILFSGKWNITPTAILLGGIDAAGHPTGEAWAFDGKVWGRLSNTPPPAISGMAIFPYNTVRISPSTWRVTEQASIIALGGRLKVEDGAVAANDTVYVSNDFGITWRVAATSLQLPDWMPRVDGAQALVVERTLRVAPDAAPQSRVSAPVTEWECPYIYLFGGREINGTTVATVRRGVINKFTFKPIY